MKDPILEFADHKLAHGFHKNFISNKDMFSAYLIWCIKTDTLQWVFTQKTFIRQFNKLRAGDFGINWIQLGKKYVDHRVRRYDGFPEDKPEHTTTIRGYRNVKLRV